MAAASAQAGKVLMEAFHWRYHPVAARIVEIATSGVLGKVTHVETSMCVPILLPGNIRYDYALGGGATMDVGSYAIHMLRHLAGAEPEVVRAEAKLSSPKVDRCMRADFAFEGGRTGSMRCSLFSARLLDISARVVGGKGELKVWNPVAPQFGTRSRAHRGGDEEGAGAWPPDLRASAPRVRRRGARGGADSHAAERLDRQHAGHRRRVREGGAAHPWRGLRVTR